MSKNSGNAFVGFLILVTLIGIITSVTLISHNKNTEVTTSPDFSVATNPNGPHFGDFLRLTTPTATTLVSTSTLTPSATPIISLHITPTPTATPTPTLSPSPSPSLSPSSSPSPTTTFTPTPTLKPTSTPTSIPTFSPSPTPQQSQDTYFPKVYLLIFNPMLQTKNNVRLISDKGWSNPTDLANQYIPVVRAVSHNIINYGVVEIKEVDDIPLKQDGFKYTEESYLACIENRGPCHNQPWTADYANYNKILDDNQICQKVNNSQVDELWMFGGPWFGFWEANMAGPNSFSTNGPVISNTSCQKPLHIMGFGYERGMPDMVHDLGHRIEGTMTNFLAGQVWSQFKSSSACGDIHYPPNTTIAYIYWNDSSINSSCDDWYNYPNLKNEVKNISCQVWGCTDLGFYKWWMQHLSYKSGTDNYKKLNNWWSYITNTRTNTNPN